MNIEEFLKLYSNFYGEKVDNLEQICVSNFTGHELFEFVKAVLFAEELKNDKVIGIIGHGSGDEIAFCRAIAESGEHPRGIVILDNSKVTRMPESPKLTESKPFIVENLPELKEPFFQKAKHEPKGHQRPYKFHR